MCPLPAPQVELEEEHERAAAVAAAEAAAAEASEAEAGPAGATGWRWLLTWLQPLATLNASAATCLALLAAGVAVGAWGFFWLLLMLRCGSGCGAGCSLKGPEKVTRTSQLTPVPQTCLYTSEEAATGLCVTAPHYRSSQSALTCYSSGFRSAVGRLRLTALYRLY